MGAEFAANVRDVLLIRYRLIPFLYSLFHRSYALGGTVARPLMFEFTSDVNTYAIDKQMLWGESFLITPVLEEGATSVEGYFPAAVWYDYYTGARMAGVSPAGGATFTLDAPMDYIPLHIRGGYIFPAQQPAMTTAVARTQPFELLVALDDSGVANGFMFWDDGRSLNTLEDGKYLFVQFNATFSLDNGINQGLLTSTPVHTAFAPQAKLGNVVVMGVDWTPSCHRQRCFVHLQLRAGDASTEHHWCL